MYLSSQHTFVLESYPIPSQNKFQNAYEFLNEKLGREEMKNNSIYIIIMVFYADIYTMTIKTLKYLHFY